MTKHNDTLTRDELTEAELDNVSGGAITVGSLSTIQGGNTTAGLAKISDAWGVAAEFVPKVVAAPTGRG